jgi:hypothetical protein
LEAYFSRDAIHLAFFIGLGLVLVGLILTGWTLEPGDG